MIARSETDFDAELPNGDKVWETHFNGRQVVGYVGKTLEQAQEVPLLDQDHNWLPTWTAPVRSKLENILMLEGMRSKKQPMSFARDIFNEIKLGNLTIYDAERLINVYNQDREDASDDDSLPEQFEDLLQVVGRVDKIGTPPKYSVTVSIAQKSGHISMSSKNSETGEVMQLSA